MKRALFGFAALIGFLYLYPFPYFEAMGSANELPRIYLTAAMVDDGTFAIDRGVADYRTQYRHEPVDTSPSGGHQYSNKAPGSSMLAIPAYLVLKGVCALFGTAPTMAQKTWAFRVATGVVPTLFFLLLFWRFLGRWAPDPDARRLALAGYAVGSMAFIYSILFISHQLSAVLVASAWMLAVWVVEGERGRRWLPVIGFLAGAAVLCDYQAAFAGVPVAVYLVWKLLAKQPRSERSPRESEAGSNRMTPWASRRWLDVAFAGLGALPPIALLLLYHAHAFGSPWRTGYAASEAFAHFHQKGFLGMDRLRGEAFLGSTVAPDNGLFFLCPMLLLLVPGLVILFRRGDRWTAGVCGAVVVIYLLFISSLSFWRGGWQVGPRYVTVMLPFAMVPVAVAIQSAYDAPSSSSGWWWWAAVVALVAYSVAVYALTAATFPHYPETFKNPFHELVLRLIGEGYSPWNAGWLLGLRGVVSLAPYLFAVAALLAITAIPRRARLFPGAIGLTAAVLLLALTSLAPGGGAPAAHSYHRITTWMPR